VTAKRLDGKALAQTRRATLADRVQRLRTQGITPRLGVILPTADEAAGAYFRAKQRIAEKVGVEIASATLESPTTTELVSQIMAWTKDPEISGMMVEAPLPEAIDVQVMRDALPASKDVDGAGSESLGRLLAGTPAFVPATAAAALALARTEVDLVGKRAVVIGRSLVVGRPLALLLLAAHATVTVCHSRTTDLAAITRNAEVLFAAVGRAGFVTEEMVAPGATVIDIGTNYVNDKLVGDVDADAVGTIAGALSPVPGGVGPLTTTLLLEQVVSAAEHAAGTAIET